MRIEQVMARPVQCCRPGDSMARAAQLMWDHDCGAIPVCEGDGAMRVVGIITDRDICMHALFEGRPLQDLRVSDAMSREVQVCRPADSLADAEKRMKAAKLRRLPVVDDQGSLVGIVALADLAQEALRQRNTASREISESEVAGTLAAICAPQHRDLAA